MIIDGHVHAGKGDLLTDPWNTDAPLEEYLRRARKAGIQKSVVFAPFHSDYAQANAQVARIVARCPDRLIGFAFLHPVRDAGRVLPLVRKAVLEYGFRGLKIHGHQATPTREVCEVARAFGLPMLLDVAGKTGVIDMIASQYPDLNLIIPHFGSFADDWRAQQQVVDLMARYPRVHADTSGVRRFDYLVQALERVGPERILFGSDGPWLHPGLELEKIRLLEASPRAEALMLGENLLRLLGPRRKGSGRASQAHPPSIKPQTQTSSGIGWERKGAMASVNP